TLLVATTAVSIAGCRHEEPEVLGIDLIRALDGAEKRSQTKSQKPSFTVQNVTINGQTIRTIFAPPHSRITWTVTAPRGALFRTALGLLPDAWNREGDGVQFRVGVTETVYEQYIQQIVNPFGRSRDRRWFFTSIDLSAYSNQTIKVILNTDPGLPGSSDMR